MMATIEEAFDERLLEVEAYLQFLEEMETAAAIGVPRFGTSGAPLSQLQIEILRAGVFIQLYNLVEAMMTKALDALATATFDGKWKPAQFTPAFRREWAKVVAAVNVEMDPGTRLNYVVGLTELLVASSEVEPFKIEKGGGGNWDDVMIERMLSRLGVSLILAPTVRTAVKSPWRNRMNVMRVVTKLRNDLAHGSMSFAECGQSETARSLRDATHKAAMYVRSVVRAIDRFIERHEYLEARHRP